MARGMLVNSAAAISAPQWYTSPRTSAIGTPRLTVVVFTELMKVRAYTNSCSTSVKLNTTTVKIPGTISRGHPESGAAADCSGDLDGCRVQLHAGATGIRVRPDLHQLGEQDDGESGSPDRTGPGRRVPLG